MSKSFFLALLVSIFLSGIANAAYAATKDSDVDGLTDQAEINIYRTDPLNHDSDGDTVTDGQEIIDGTNPLDRESSKLAQLSTDQKSSANNGSGIYVLVGSLVLGLIALRISIALFRKES